MNEINYETEVRKVYPDASHVEFPMALFIHHIRLYGDGAGLPKSIGKGDSEIEAWEFAYRNLTKQL